MSIRTKHQEYTHQHGFACGHVAIIHAGHTDYLLDGHLQHAHLDHVDEHVRGVSATNPEACTSITTVAHMTRLMYMARAVHAQARSPRKCCQAIWSTVASASSTRESLLMIHGPVVMRRKP